MSKVAVIGNTARAIGAVCEAYGVEHTPMAKAIEE